MNMPCQILFLAAAAGLLLGILIAGALPRLWLITTLAGAAAACAAAVDVMSGGGTWGWSSRFLVGGAPVVLRFDGLSAFFLVLLGVVGGAGALFAHEYWADAKHPRSAAAGRRWWNTMLLSLGFVLLAADGLHFLIAWEMFALSAYFLITVNREPVESRAAGWLYLAASHAATLILFAFFAIMAARTGSWELGPMRQHAELAPLFWLMLAGFGIKAGLFPLHIWLPSAHANAPSHVSAILSGVTLKIAIYGLMRFSGWLPLPDAAGWVVVVLGVAGAVLGVAFALGQHDLKRLLAYHSVENIGIILIGLGFALLAVQNDNPMWGSLALAGALLHVWNHGLFKSLLFFGAGSVVHATGTREMSKLGGLWRAMPWTASLFGLGAIAICGLPPLNGFVSEWLVYLGLFDATIAHGSPAWAAIPSAIFLGMTGALALACFAKVCGVVFGGAPRSAAAAGARESGPAMRGAMLALALGCVAIGLAPAAFWPALTRAMDVWNPAWAGNPAPPALLTLGRFNVGLATGALLLGPWLWYRVRRRSLARSVTWDCGYAHPGPRMQYTVGSFAGIINEWFAWILRPQRRRQAPEGVFPARSHDSEEVPETVLEKIVFPVAALVLRVSSAVRSLQHGRVQSYVLYLLIGIGLLSLLILMGGGQ